jgi:hypothetical protein
MKRPVTFYSEGVKLVGDVYAPDDLRPGERRGGKVLCHGYTGVKDLYLPDNACVLNDAGYVRPVLAPALRGAPPSADVGYTGISGRDGALPAHKPRGSPRSAAAAR